MLGRTRPGPRPGTGRPLGSPAGTGQGVRDTLGRSLRDLRIPITDRCNFRCTYCMPKEVFGRSHRFLPRDQLLTFEEITRLAGIFIAHGVGKIRITGGEPLLRRDVERLIEMISGLDGLRQVAGCS